MKRYLPWVNIVALLVALAGIAFKQSATPMVANSAWFFAALVLLMIPLALWFRRNMAASGAQV